MSDLNLDTEHTPRNIKMELPTDVRQMQSERVEKEVRFSMSLNRHQRRFLGRRNKVKIPSDKNYNLVEGKLKLKE